MTGREKRARGGTPTSVEVRRRSGRSSIIRHRSSFINRYGFTLIELLVVISIVALLMAILAPTLQRVRKQARAVVCQANLKQWGVFLATYVSENDGRLPAPSAKERDDPHYIEWWGCLGGWGSDAWAHDQAKDIRCCPMAARLANPTGTSQAQSLGGTFLAWGRFWPEGEGPLPGWNPRGSYGINSCVTGYWYNSVEDMRLLTWQTPDVRDAGSIPVYFDHAAPWAWTWAWDSHGVEPPACDSIPTGFNSQLCMSPCINRHEGGINVAFLDWSVRKVGLKELWTLKWNRRFSTSGHWTKAGGVKLEEWPAWMRGFKDY